MAFIIKIIKNDISWKKEYEQPILIINAIAESGIMFDAPCGGNGICGNCKIMALGSLSEPDAIEIECLEDKITQNYRLACRAYATNNATVIIPSNKATNSIAFKSIAEEQHPNGDYERFGCAIDVGTTSIVFKYFSLPAGKLEYINHIENPQRIRGADVITRISYAANGGLQELKAIIDSAIERSNNKFGRPIDLTVITGNTVMLHILSGRNPYGLSVAPFTPETLFGHWEENTFFMPCASAYIGGDVIAALITLGDIKSQKPFALMDIGTNNECILWNGKQLFACSSPAGPAFEGANISCGMIARDGAISSIIDNDGNAIIETIGNTSEAYGFCGSGLIDAVSFLYSNGYIGFDGSVLKPLPSFNGVSLSPEDIAELLLAKSAVISGLLTLCKEANISTEELETIYLCGSFGNKINANSAELIGMIPKDCAAKTAVSQSAIDGASMLLLNNELIEDAKSIAKEIRIIELADNEHFAKSFIENLYFQ